MRESTKDIFSGLLLLLLATGVFIYSFFIRVFIPIDIGSGIFPRIVAILLGLVSLFIIRNGVRQRTQEQETPGEKQYVNVFGVAASIFCIMAYIFALGYLGFFAASILYLFVQFCVLAPTDKKTMVWIAILSLCIPIIVYSLFVYGFTMILP